MALCVEESLTLQQLGVLRLNCLQRASLTPSPIHKIVTFAGKELKSLYDVK